MTGRASTDASLRDAGAPAGPKSPQALAAAGAALLGLLALATATAVLAGAGAAMVGPQAAPGGGAEPSELARADIPPRYLALYRAAGSRYGIDWSVLAGIGRVECDHGRDPDPSCTQQGAVNAAGAGGPMQFLPATWDVYGVDGDGDGRRDRWDPADAIDAAAYYLRASGAPGDYPKAIYAYNHDRAYVESVEEWARRYRAQPSDGEATGLPVGTGSLVAMQALTRTPIREISGERARLAPGDGHLALVPAGVPLTVAAMIVAGNELQNLPYGPAGHPDPLGASEQDCSSSLNYVLFRAGIRPLGEIVRENPLAQDYVSWGEPGPGRWVTIYATVSPTDHVFVTIAGLRLDTSHNGTDVGPNRNEDGPRWRVLDRIPDWAHWSVRHPPGL
ncbi:MAG TPA: lytic murein transglycosylase [Solirubrobacteraceae bacterium]|nr:lytic murein transglycosylase [Solirubrobacteraceae bacterium]